MSKSNRPRAAPQTGTRAHPKPPKHLLETSLLRPLTCRSQTFKERIHAELGDGRRYTSRLVRMEFRRGLLLRLAEFCIQLQLPTVHSADDLLNDWANHFGDRDAKIAVYLCRQLLPAGIDLTSPTTKPAVFRRVAQLLLELEARLTEGTTESPDAGHRCERAVPHLVTRATYPEEILQALVAFADRIQDTAYCRAHCTIDRFLQSHQAMVDTWTAEADSVHGDARKAMQTTAPHATSTLNKGPEAWSCKDCEKLGDWIITLDCPPNLQIEHLDHIYDYLCPSRGLAHRKHPPDRLDLKRPPPPESGPPDSRPNTPQRTG